MPTAQTLIIDSFRPLVVTGNIRLRVYRINAAVADADTAAIVEFNTVIGALFVPATAAGCGIALSGAGNRTLTFKLTAGVTNGLLFVWGF